MAARAPVEERHTAASGILQPDEAQTYDPPAPALVQEIGRLVESLPKGALHVHAELPVVLHEVGLVRPLVLQLGPEREAIPEVELRPEVNAGQVTVESQVLTEWDACQFAPDFETPEDGPIGQQPYPRLRFAGVVPGAVPTRVRWRRHRSAVRQLGTREPVYSTSAR
jgi:hypothetical protein